MVENIVFPYRYPEEEIVAMRMGNGLVDRLAWLAFKPQTILILGTGAQDMADQLRFSHSAATFYFEIEEVNSLVDLVLVNGVLSFAKDFTIACQHYQSLLNPNGVLAMSVFGIDTLKEWHQHLPISPGLIDMHDLGDLLVGIGMIDPVLDTEYFTLSYKNSSQFMKEMRQSQLFFPQNNIENLPQQEEYLATMEIIFAHTFKASQKTFAAVDGVVNIPISHLKSKKL